MILTGRKLEEIGKALYGDIWLSSLSKKLKRSKRTILRWTGDKNAMPTGLRQVLVDLIDEQFAALGECKDELTAHWDDV